MTQHYCMDMDMGMDRVAVLFATQDSIYKRLPGTDVYDVVRDARTFSGGAPIVAHPPCRAWGQLRHMAKPRNDEAALALFAVGQVRRWGGVLEHPARSALWHGASLPEPGTTDAWGGWTLVVPQCWWGHKAEKMTRLYIVGVRPADVPAVPLILGEPKYILGTSGRRRDGTRASRRPEMPKREREATPADFAAWLLALARQSRHKQ